MSKKVQSNVAPALAVSAVECDNLGPDYIWSQSLNDNNVYFKSLSYTNVLFKLEMNAQQNKISLNDNINERDFLGEWTVLGKFL